MFSIGEVMEIKKAFKSGQKDDEGNTLPLGSIKVRLGGHSRISGNILHVWARPAYFDARRIPLIGEQVMIFLAPAHDQTDGISKPNNHYYLNPINTTDDLVLHQLPGVWLREKGTGIGGGGLSSPPKPGDSFPAQPTKVNNIQPFEGDTIIESRLGSSIRLGSSLTNFSPYDESPTWQGSNGDPITILRVKKPQGGGGASKYTIEDLKNDDSSIYLTTGQKLTNVSVAFSKNLDAQKIPTFSGNQVLVDSEQVVLNAREKMLILNAKEKSVLAGKEVVFQSDTHNVNLDDLMTYIKDILSEVTNLASATAQFATPAGPTAASTNVAQFQKLLNADFNTKFKTP